MSETFKTIPDYDRLTESEKVKLKIISFTRDLIENSIIIPQNETGERGLDSTRAAVHSALFVYSETAVNKAKQRYEDEMLIDRMIAETNPYRPGKYS